MGSDIFPQTTYTQFNAPAFQGQLFDPGNLSDTESAVISETGGVDAGLGVIYDGAPPNPLTPGWIQKVKYPTASSDKIAGFTVLQVMKQPTGSNPRFAVKDPVALVRKGRLWVLLTSNVTKGDDVYVCYSGTKGGCQNTAGGVAAKARGCIFFTSGTSGGLAVVDVNIPVSGSVDASAGQSAWNVTAVQTADYTATIGDLARINPTGGVINVTLPTAVGKTGQAIKVVDYGAAGAGASATHTITITPAGSEKIDGASTKTITTNAGELTLVSDGAGWLSAAAA